MKDPTLLQVSSPEGVLTAPSAAAHYDHQIFNQDAADMARLGKVHQFNRVFGFWATLGTVSIYMATWEFTLISMAPSISTAGFGGFFWTFVACTACYASVVLSLAELASISPTSGGQYHWVSEFAPAGLQRYASYASGWMSSLGWLASLAGGNYVCAELVQVCVRLAWPGHGPMPSWQLFLVLLALLLVTVVLNTLGARVLPLLEVVSLVGHILGFVVFVGVLWGRNRPLNTPREAFLGFENGSGWDNYGMACLLTQVSIIWSMLGSDTIVHISEEVKDASLTVARAMWWSYVANMAMAIVMVITILFCIGPLADLDPDVPYVTLFSNTGSDRLALCLTIVLFILILSGNITALAATSREIWAFARDKGFPFSPWIARFNHQYDMPFNAVYLSTFLAVLISLVSLGSSFAFNVIASLSLLALMSTYMLSIGCVLLRRVRGDALPPARWSLGRLGLPVNALAVAYSGFVVVLSCFPDAVGPGPLDANWAPAIWGAVVLLSIFAYVFHGKNHFTPPVMFIEGRRGPGAALQKVS